MPKESGKGGQKKELCFKMSDGQSGYVFVCADELSKDDGVELPTEEDGSLLLSVLHSQFEGASGLKYRWAKPNNFTNKTN